MATPSYIFIMVGKTDNPIYEAEFSRKKEENRHLNQFIVHSALDMVDESMWTTNSMFLKTVDKFNEQLVSAFVTAGQVKFMLLHEARNEDGIKNFFNEVHELYIKLLMNPFYTTNTKIFSPVFDARVHALAKRFLGTAH